VNNYLEALRIQRWDDHRFYHHSRINQSLHLVSAISFVLSYGLLFKDPALAALIAWGVGMVTRQAGHFFFEPHSYDDVNKATHAHKEDIKVGYNLRRKVVLMSVWAAAPVLLALSPSLFGTMEPGAGLAGYLHNVGVGWFVLGVVGVCFRTVHLFFLRSVLTGLIWMLKIITDPFHDIMIYWQSPLALARGELIDPMNHAREHSASKPDAAELDPAGPAETLP